MMKPYIIILFIIVKYISYVYDVYQFGNIIDKVCITKKYEDHGSFLVDNECMETYYKITWEICYPE